ncbi:MAG: protein kinase, partial [Bowdeniella nasicola]|nr:protein kinase [Bowdeniella nasicola]
MSQVYVAHDQRLDRNVALKIMHPYLAESDEFVRLFRREARAAARLSHPGIVAVYDQGNTGDSFYLTMEYIEGGNLRQYLAHHGSLSVGQALEITAQILSALAAAHSAGLVHRDIKPENVLLPAGGGVKVVDFGLA